MLTVCTASTDLNSSQKGRRRCPVKSFFPYGVSGLVPSREVLWRLEVECFKKENVEDLTKGEVPSLLTSTIFINVWLSTMVSVHTFFKNNSTFWCFWRKAPASLRFVATPFMSLLNPELKLKSKCKTSMEMKGTKAVLDKLRRQN